MMMVKPYYPTLEAEISKNGIKKQDIAKALNITPRALSQKMKGQVDFWWKEVATIQSIFPNIPAEKLLEHERSE
ncbi:MAG: hypothetical protein ACI4SF_00600 [Oscillospiraceae bacterium]